MVDCKPCAIPIDVGMILNKSEGTIDAKGEKFPYRELIGGLT